MQQRGDLHRFSMDGFTFKMMQTTILRDTHKNHIGWEVYNDRAMLVDWFYTRDAHGTHPAKFAEEQLRKKFDGRQDDEDVVHDTKDKLPDPATGPADL